MRLILCSTLGCLVFGCAGPPPEAAPPLDRAVSFADEIQPMLTDNCATCHAPGGLASAYVDLRAGVAYSAIIDAPSEQDATFTLVVRGDAEASLLYTKVSSAMPPIGSTMPLFAGPLTSEEIGLIRDWINQGALDN